MIDTYAIDKVADGWNTGGTYSVDDENKLVSYKLKGGAMSVPVIEAFVRLANHTGYVFQTKFNDKELSVAPGMTDEQVKKNFFGENYKAEEFDTHAVDEMTKHVGTLGTYEVDHEEKLVSYKLKGGATIKPLIENFTALANHTGYVFQTEIYGYGSNFSASPGMTEKQVQTAWMEVIHKKDEEMRQRFASVRGRFGETYQNEEGKDHPPSSTSPKTQKSNTKFTRFFCNRGKKEPNS